MITEFKSAKYGKIRTTTVNEIPYICMTDMTKMLGITNSHLVRNIIPDRDIISIEVGAKKKGKRLFVKSDHVTLCVHKSKLENAEMIGEWIYKSVLPRLLNLDKELHKLKDPNKVVEILEELNDLRVRNAILESETKLSKPKLNFINKLIGSSECIDLDMIIDVVKYPGLKLTEVYKILRYFQVVDSNNVPYQEYCDKKYFRIVEAKTVCNGALTTTQRTYVYKSGIAFIERLLRKYEVRNYDAKTN